MILETIRLLAAALADGTTGINAQLATVPRDSGDPQPPNVTVVEETTSPWAARGVNPQEITTPYAVVSQAGPLVMEGEAVATYRKGRLSVAVEILSPKSASAEATRALLYTARAVQRAVRVWLADASSALRTDNDVYVEIAEQWTQSPVVPFAADSMTLVELQFDLLLRDTAPGTP
jgi:hypothetical protein